MLSVFVFFVLQHLLDSYLLSCLPICTEIHYPESSFTCDALYLVFVQDVMRFIFVIDRDAIFGKLVGLCFKGFLVMGRFI